MKSKKIKTRDRHKANPERSIALSESLKNGIYFYQHGILPLILAYTIWNMHHNIALLKLYLHI